MRISSARPETTYSQGNPQDLPLGSDALADWTRVKKRDVGFFSSRYWVRHGNQPDCSISGRDFRESLRWQIAQSSMPRTAVFGFTDPRVRIDALVTVIAMHIGTLAMILSLDRNACMHHSLWFGRDVAELPSWRRPRRGGPCNRRRSRPTSLVHPVDDRRRCLAAFQMLTHGRRRHFKL